MCFVALVAIAALSLTGLVLGYEEDNGRRHIREVVQPLLSGQIIFEEESRCSGGLQCVDVKSCRSLLHLLKKPMRTSEELVKLRSSLCGFVLGSPYVCCPDKTCKTPDDKLGSCVSLYECPHMLALLSKPTPVSPQVLGHVKQFVCNGSATYSVCCDATPPVLPTPYPISTSTPTPTASPTPQSSLPPPSAPAYLTSPPCSFPPSLPQPPSSPPTSPTPSLSSPTSALPSTTPTPTPLPPPSLPLSPPSSPSLLSSTQSSSLPTSSSSLPTSSSLLPLDQLLLTLPEEPADCVATTLPQHPSSGCCGNDVFNQDKIIGGNETGLDQYPWLALIEYRKNNKIRLLCGGTLISSRYVITAAHCLTGRIRRLAVPKNVRLGEYDTNSEIDCVETDGGGEDCADPVVVLPIELYVPHPQYSGEISQHNDIGVIRMAMDAPYTDFIRPICLPTADSTLTHPSKLNLFAAGWGAVSAVILGSNIKLHVDLPYYPNDQCRLHYADPIRNVTLWDKQLCAGGVEGMDTCKGDSGGPLMNKKGSFYELIGVISFGTFPCGWKLPGVYTKVYEYNDWIQSLMHE